MPFDLRTKEKKDYDEVHARVRRDLDNLESNYIPVEKYDVGKDSFFPQFRSPHPDGPNTFCDYFFADRDLRFIHCMSFDENGNRIRRWVLNILKVDKVHFKFD
jgi:hypothetical protein